MEGRNLHNPERLPREGARVAGGTFLIGTVRRRSRPWPVAL